MLRHTLTLYNFLPLNCKAGVLKTECCIENDVLNGLLFDFSVNSATVHLKIL